MKKNLLLAAVLFSTYAISQVGINTKDPKAALDVVSSSSGILIPRMSAAIIEQIASPAEGEIVFSNSNNGTLINLIGFWYFDGTSWQPMIASSATGINIYNTNGTLSDNRLVTMDNHNLNIGPGKVFISGTSNGNIGFLNTIPTQKIDVNGGMRVRSLSAGNVLTNSEGVLTTDANLVYQFGDIRYSSVTTDHDGWYLMNGRSLSTLSATAQARATSLGIAGTLPNAADRYIRQGIPGTATGESTAVLTQGNMPNFTMTGTTTTLAHSHNLLSPGFLNIRATDLLQTASGNSNIWQIAGGAEPGSISSNQVYTSTAAGAHSHTVTVPSGGTNIPIALNPSYIQLNYFIYLGN